MRILDEKQEGLLKAERRLLDDLRTALAQFGGSPEDQQALGQSIRQLDELFLLVVVGEFNSGKSAFINALLGQKLLAEGVTPTTTQINILRYGPHQERSVEGDNLQVLTAPLGLLAEINIVDTPGTNAIIRQHEVITSQFVPRSDLVCFITSADRPFTESERLFLERIQEWGKKVVVVLNKVDLLQSAADRDKIVNFIAENMHALFDLRPEIFPVSARQALRAKQGEPELWNASGFGPLEQFIHDTLDEIGRIRLKLLNPLGVGLHLAEKYQGAAASRLELLAADVSTLADVESQLGLYREDMQRDFNFRMADVENLLFEMEQRGQDYFDETLRLERVFDLLNKARIQTEFSRRVIADVPQRIEARVGDLIDWLVDADLRQWQAVMEHLAERRRQHQERIVGGVGLGSFHHDRQRLIEGVGRETQRVVETYDRAREAESIAQAAQTAVAAAAALEVGAVGLGTLVYALATTVAADVTGVLLASLVAALGFFVIPARRRQAKREMRLKIAALRENLVRSLKGQFEKEIERSLNAIHGAIAPYTRFVRAERGKLIEAEAGLEDIKTGLLRLKAQVEEL